VFIVHPQQQLCPQQLAGTATRVIAELKASLEDTIRKLLKVTQALEDERRAKRELEVALAKDVAAWLSQLL
jgi:hypothetical protein